MGKTRKSKAKFGLKVNPIGLEANEVDDFLNACEEFESSGSGPIESIRDQLQNANIEEKLNGLQSFAVLTASKDKVAAICQSDTVRIAAPLLCEKDLSVRNAAAGALRNLSVNGTEVCDFLVEQDVLTPLLALLAEYAHDNEWRPTFDENMCNQMDLRSDIFLQAINLLWNLCESSSIAVDTFNQTNLMGSFIRCLDFNVFGLDIAVSVAQCLLVVTENNPKSWVVLNVHVPNFLCLLSLKGDYGHAYLGTLAAGILSNAPALAASYSSTILKTLSEVLDTNQQTALNSIIGLSVEESKENAPELEINMDTQDDESEEAAANRRRRQELPTKADLAVRNIGYLLDAQRVAAEVITNLCSPDDEEWSDMDDEAVSENESIVDYESKMSNGSTTNLNEGDKLPLDIIEAIKSLVLVDKLWQRSQPLDTILSQQLRDSNITLLMKAKNLRISSLLCLQNLCNCLNAEDLGGHSAIYNVWVDLGQQVFKGAKDPTILEPCTSLMRASLEHLKTKKGLFNQMTQSDLELILDGVRSCSMPEIRANWLRMLGSLGCLLNEALVKVIVSFIVETCAKEDDVWTISEAIDALMDMFSDNDWHQILLDLNLPIAIKELEKQFKTKVRSQRKELRDRYPAVQTVLTNLSRFTKYIEKEALNYTNGTRST
ncbi:HEAT repeat-containing protein 3 [Stomoxys calcitrans]|uniref:SYO1-like TPR repeats domain-containing protein n=1 Tax=Stomoxys calcitrans TaxID=35570 RepID=A0A1I8PHJ1_STOCA|nr:HEAT repeat-containing protein 3 [Stomoxys calcitrans]